jgi:AraC family transcriptional regulator
MYCLERPRSVWEDGRRRICINLVSGVGVIDLFYLLDTNILSEPLKYPSLHFLHSQPMAYTIFHRSRTDRWRNLRTSIPDSVFMPASSQSSELIDPSSLIPADWLLSRRSMQSGGLIVEHHLEPADTIESPPISQHLMCLFFSDSPHQVTQFEKLEFDGACRPGDLWLLPASSCSALWSWKSTDEVMAFTINPPLLDEIALASDCANSAGLELKPLVYQHDPQLLAIAQSFKQEMTQVSIASQLYTDALALQFTIHLLRHYTTQPLTPKQYPGGLSQPQVQYLTDYIQAHLDRPIHLEELAALLHMSQYHFCRLFKRSTGRSPHQFVIQQRVDRAKQLLQRSNQNLLEIATHCGFTDSSHLARHFRKHTGSSPTTFRRQS